MVRERPDGGTEEPGAPSAAQDGPRASAGIGRGPVAARATDAASGDVKAPRAIVVIGDLMIGSRVRDTMTRLGIEARYVATPHELDQALRAPASLAIVDLGERRIDPQGAIRAARASGARVLAFGSHVDVAGLREAEAAGADKVVPRSAFAAGHAALIEELLGKERGIIR